MEVKQLKYGTYIIYNNKVGLINSITNTDNVNIKYIDDNSIESVKKNKLKIIPHNKNEVVKYKDIYYIIKNIIVDNNLPIYILNYINSGFNKIKKPFSLKIKSTDQSIISINKKNQEKIISYLKFLDRYNSAMNYLCKKTNKPFERLDYKSVDIDMNNLFNFCKLKISQLDKICNAIKKSQNLDIQIKFIKINPFNFITQDYQLLSYEKAEKICNEYYLTIDFKIKLEKWTYDLFLREKNTFYLPKWLYDSETKKFCENRKENYNNFQHYIKTFIIEKEINKSIYVTTQHLLNIEKSMSDLMINLFDKNEYDICNDEINNLIKLYEEKTSKIKEIMFLLEEEQKKSVLNSIKNKFSIITGPPGTGKTEILKCINFVLYELYKKENLLEESKESEESEESEELEESEESEELEESEESEESEEFNENDNKFINPKTIGLIAPTGLAYINMYRNQEAKHYNNKISGTCHKTLYHIFSNIQKHKKHCDCENKCKYILNVKMIQLDEASMLDTFVFYDLLKYCKYFNSRLILLGDVEQLPSIGPGKILKHLIDSEIFTVTKLSKIKRQNSGSLVNNILKMSTNTVQVADCSIDETMTLYNIEKYIINNKEINNQELELLIDKCNFNQENVKFITGFATEKKIFNTNNLNNLLQNKFNLKNDIIPSNHKYEDSFVFKVKDKIIRVENDYSSKKMRANGEEASILDFDGTKVIIQYSGAEDKPEKIGIDELYENFRLNYCITVHKSQGSQYQNVIFIIEPNQTFTDKKSIYTAISRAKSRCIIISKPCDFINLQKDLKKIDFKVSLLLKESDNYTFPN